MHPQTLGYINDFVTLAGTMLKAPVMRLPHMSEMRKSLLREIVVGDQLLAKLRDGAQFSECADLWAQLRREHELVKAKILTLYFGDDVCS